MFEQITRLETITAQNIVIVYTFQSRTNRIHYLEPSLI
jgi:hypothetical protein